MPSRLRNSTASRGPYSETITTTDGPLKGTLRGKRPSGTSLHPANARQRSADCLPSRRARLHPVRLGDNVSRDELIRSPGIVQTPTRATTCQQTVLGTGSADHRRQRRSGHGYRRDSRRQKRSRRRCSRGRRRRIDLRPRHTEQEVTSPHAIVSMEFNYVSLVASNDRYHYERDRAVARTGHCGHCTGR
jgi:hypothetical protein